MSREYSSANDKMQKTTDNCKIEVVKYSYVPAIVIFVLAILSVFLGKMWIFIMPILFIVGLLFFIASLNCRITMSVNSITVRNFFRISRTYSCKKIKFWQENAHHIYFYLANGDRIGIRRRYDVDNCTKYLIANAQKSGASPYKTINDSKLFWGNCSNLQKQVFLLILVFLIGVGCMVFSISAMISASEPTELESYTFTVTDVRRVERSGFQLYEGDVIYFLDDDLLKWRSPFNLRNTEVTVLKSGRYIYELTDSNNVTWYTAEEHEAELYESTIGLAHMFLAFSITAFIYMGSMLLAYRNPRKFYGMYKYFEPQSVLFEM